MNNVLENVEEATYVASALEQYAFEYRQNVYAPHFLRARKIVVDYLLSHLSEHSRVLDVNCGTGIDLVEIAKRGHRVQGVDISSTMISFARKGIEESGVAGLAEADAGDYRQLRAFDHPFDAVLSNFGGINFGRDLRPIFDSVDKNLRDGGIFLVNSVGHFCMSESLIFLAKGKFSKAFRRVAGGRARIGGKWVQLYYHTKNSLVKTGAQFGFQPVSIFGLNIFAPPLWAESFFESHRRLSSKLEKMDDRVRYVPGFRTIGDFLVVVFKKGKVEHFWTGRG